MSSDDARSAKADPLAALHGPTPPTTWERIGAVVARIPPDARPWALGLGVALVAAVVAVIVAAGVLARGGGGSSVPAASVDDAVEALPYAGTSTPPTTAAPALLVVHAAGAVDKPGLYRLDAGSRVGDLLTAAGGAASDGDLDRVNLAAVLVDGARIYVPRRGEPDVPALVESDTAGTSSGPTDATGAGPLDLNRATIDQLETLPGVGPSIAAAILDHRERNGPFAAIDELLDVRGIGPARLEQLRALVRV